MDFFNYDSEVTLDKGSILISEPFLPDQNFERSVILLCEHDENGSLGFVLNKPTNLIVKDILEDEINLDNKVYIGGPVQQDSFHFIHKDNTIEGAKKVTDQLFWGGNFEQLKYIAQSGMMKTENYKFFIGYSGWSEGQLERELESKSWIVAKNIECDVLLSSGSDEIWKTALDKLGGRFRLYSKYPVDPRLN